jgi:hypothetical protein
MRGAIHPLPPYVFTTWYLVKHMDKFTLPYLVYERGEVSFMSEASPHLTVCNTRVYPKVSGLSR